jgi:hypothetical protein
MPATVLRAICSGEGRKLRMKVFVSSVIVGLEAERDAAAEAIRTLGFEVLRTEDYPATSTTPQRACLAGVRDVDAVVLLMGDRYGEVQDSGLSATHEEFHEARERCPVLVFVKAPINPEPAQRNFLEEVQSWASGFYSSTFTSVGELRTRIIQALHDLDVSLARGGPDESEGLDRARALVPEPLGMGSDLLMLVVVASPRQAVLRPAELEDPQLHDELVRQALTGPYGLLDIEQGTHPHLRGSALEVEQDDRRHTVRLSEDGTIMIGQPASVDRDHRTATIPSLVEEDINDRLERAIRFAATVMDRIDSRGRITHVVLLATIVGAGWMGWRSRAEYERSHGGGQMGSGGERVVAELTPAMRPRAALMQQSAALARDLTIHLRREVAGS